MNAKTEAIDEFNDHGKNKNVPRFVAFYWIG